LTVPSNPSNPSNQPQPAGRSRKRRFALLATGLGLVALVGAYFVVQLIREDAPDLETDFSSETCEDFDLSAFEEFSGGPIEFDSADAGKLPDTEAYSLNCQYISDSGITLTFGALADFADDFPEDALDASLETWGISPEYAIEEFDNGDYAGFTLAYEQESTQFFNLYGYADRLNVGAFLSAELGDFESADALPLVEAMAAQTFERFEAWQ
jgi:hypothetical protein